MAETLTAGRERIYPQDFCGRIACNMGAFPPEIIDTYTKAYAAEGLMKAGFEVYRASDQDGEDNLWQVKRVGKLHMPLLFVAGNKAY